MRIMIESTDQLTRLDGVEVRLWEGITADGTPCMVFVHRIVAHTGQHAAFERELAEQLPPAELVGLRRILT